MNTSVAIDSPPGWRAHLELDFEARGSRTVLARRRHVGPLLVQRAFDPEGGPCHVYILHPPGGVVGGDELRLDVGCGARAHALLTTPAAGKFYRSAGPQAHLHQHLRVDPGAALEWLPQETLIFDGANADLLTRVEVAEQSRFIGWEVLVLGRRASGEAFDSAAVRQRFELWREGRPLLLERMHLAGGTPVLSAPWGLAGRRVLSTLVATPAGPVALEAARAAIAPTPALWSASLLDEVLICRYLGDEPEEARELMLKIWSALRPQLIGREACPPRIWAT